MNCECDWDWEAELRWGFEAMESGSKLNFSRKLSREKDREYAKEQVCVEGERERERKEERTHLM